MEFLIGTTHYQPPRPKHKHKIHEIIVYLQESGSLDTSNGIVPVHGGTIAVLPPGVEHHTIPSGNLMSIYIQGNFNHILRFDQPVILNDNEYGDGINLAKMALRSRHENSDYASVLCDTFLHFILENLNFDDQIGIAVRKIIQHITENFHDPNLCLIEILNQSGYAEDYIRAQFKRITSQTPSVFLAQLRIRHACYLIDSYRNSLSLSDIAAQCGYTDYVLFSKRFKTVMNCSPRSYLRSL